MQTCLLYIEIIHNITGRKNISVIYRNLVSYVKKASLTKEVAFLKKLSFSLLIFSEKYSKISQCYLRKLFQQVVSVIVQLDLNERDFQKQPFTNVLQNRCS